MSHTAQNRSLPETPCLRCNSRLAGGDRIDGETVALCPLCERDVRHKRNLRRAQR